MPRHTPDELEVFIAEVLKDPLARTAFEDASSRHRVLDELVRRRKDAKLSQAAVARRMGIRQPTVSELESEGSDPRLLTLQRYARAVGARIEIQVVDAEPGDEDA